MEPDRQHDSVETKLFTIAELYELRRVLIRLSRSIPPGPSRNVHRQTAASMRALLRDERWLALHTVMDGKNAISHEIQHGRMIAKTG
jgi:hypothetical protein